MNLPDSIRKWCGLIVFYSNKHNLDPALTAAVMLQESGGQPNVISSSGAVGLMQVMPRDGIAASFQCANGPCFASRPSTEELLDPEYNINKGCEILAGYISKNGSEREGLRAYGPIYDDPGRKYEYADKVLAIRDSLK